MRSRRPVRYTALRFLIGRPGVSAPAATAPVSQGRVASAEAEIRKRALDTLDFLSLSPVKDELAGQISGGQKKLLEIGRTMMVDAKLVLLDEPAAGVNPALMDKICDLILTLQRERGYTFCIIEHDMNVILLTIGGIYAIIYLGLNLQWGMAGIFNAGVAGFVGIGAYSMALVTTRFVPLTGVQPLDIAAGLVAAMVLAGLTGWAVARICLRLRSDYLAIASLGVVDEARKAGLKLHMDGARLLNAQTASGISARRYAEQFDSAWIDLSKGLGAPVGGVLAGSRDFVKAAWRVKQRLGGAMRQAGFLAAAGLYALDNHVERIAEDHEHAKLLAAGLSRIDGIRVDPDDIETNIVFFDVAGTGMRGADFVAKLRSRGVGMGAFGESLVRAIPFIGHTRHEILRAVDIVAEMVETNAKSSARVT